MTEDLEKMIGRFVQFYFNKIVRQDTDSHAFLILCFSRSVLIGTLDDVEKR